MIHRSIGVAMICALAACRTTQAPERQVQRYRCELRIEFSARFSGGRCLWIPPGGMSCCFGIPSLYPIHLIRVNRMSTAFAYECRVWIGGFGA